MMVFFLSSWLTNPFPRWLRFFGLGLDVLFVCLDLLSYLFATFVGCSGMKQRLKAIEDQLLLFVH